MSRRTRNDEPPDTPGFFLKPDRIKKPRGGRRGEGWERKRGLDIQSTLERLQKTTKGSVIAKKVQKSRMKKKKRKKQRKKNAF